jgi:hypothetical protein
VQSAPILYSLEAVQSIPILQVVEYIQSIPIVAGMETLDIRTGLPPLNFVPTVEGVASIKNQLQDAGCLTGWNFLY